MVTKDTRTRNWAFIVYPDSAPREWQAILEAQNIPCFISPLHDKDVEETGEKVEPKKAHWHVMIMYQGKKSAAQVQAVSDKLSGVKVQSVSDARSYARYLCHLDNPSKAQYPVSDVVCLGGADYLQKISSAADTDTALSEMMDWCIEQGCDSFFALSNYARRNRPDWFRVLTSSRTTFLTAWLKSMEYDSKRGLLAAQLEPNEESEQ